MVSFPGDSTDYITHGAHYKIKNGASCGLPFTKCKTMSMEHPPQLKALKHGTLTLYKSHTVELDAHVE